MLVLHGPNLNLLGEREPAVYGRTTLREINHRIRVRARALGGTVKAFQSNWEGRLVDLLHQHRRWADVLIINPGALTHTSYVLRDAIEAVRIPAFEVHLSDIRKREPWRRRSVVRAVCKRQISGLGVESYLTALDAAAVLHSPLREGIVPTKRRKTREVPIRAAKR